MPPVGKPWKNFTVSNTNYLNKSISIMESDISLDESTLEELDCLNYYILIAHVNTLNKNGSFHRIFLWKRCLYRD